MFFGRLLYPSFTEMTKKKKNNCYGTFCDISFVNYQMICLSFYENGDINWMVNCSIPISLTHFAPFSPKIYMNLLKSKTLVCCSSTCKYSWNRLMKFGGGAMPLFWVTHHKTNYGVGKLKSLWGGHGKNGNILSTPKEIPINIPSHIILRSSAPGRHHIVLLDNHHSATLFLES